MTRKKGLVYSQRVGFIILLALLGLGTGCFLSTKGTINHSSTTGQPYSVKHHASTPLLSNTSLEDPLCWQSLCPKNKANTQAMVVNHKIFILGYNTQTKFADWVAYVINAKNTNGPGKRFKHKRIWQADPHIEKKQASIALQPKDYKEAYARYQYDRGHQAPLAAFAYHPLGERANYLSNITPQKACLNRGAWKKLEEAVRKMARKKTLYVVTGTFYDGKPQSPLPHASIPHQVPTGYWKLITYTGTDQKTACISTFAFSQDTNEKDSYCAHKIDWDALKKRVKYQLLPGNPLVQAIGKNATCPVRLC